ncbi:MAG: YhdP family phospholipid transporter [Marinomonas sp.]
MRKQLQRFISIALWALVCVAVLLAVAVKCLLPGLDDYRPQIESNLSQLTGYQVTLKKISGHLEGLDPTVSISDLLLSVNDKPAGGVAEIRVRVNTIKSLLTLSPQFTYVRFVKPTLALQEYEGKWGLKGAVLADDMSNSVGIERMLRYLAGQQRLSVLDADIDLVSQQYGNHSIEVPSAYAFQDSKASWIKSKVYLDGNDEPIDVNAKIYQSLGLFETYQVDASINIPKFTIPFDESASVKGIDLVSADLAGKLWLNYRVGEGVSLQIESTKLAMAFKNGESYHASPAIRVRYSQEKEGLSVEMHHLAIMDEHKKSYLPANLTYEWSATTGQSYLRFDQFDLALGDRIAQHFLQPDLDVSKLVAGLAPKGVAANAALRLGRKDNNISFHFLSNLQDASVAGYKGIPKVNKVDAVFSLTNTDGYIQFKDHQATVGFPDLYANAWKVDSLSGVVDWQFIQDTLVVSGRDINGMRGATEVKGGFRFEARKHSPDWLSLSLGVQHLPVTDRLTYIPDRVLNSKLHNWIKEAVADKGTINNLDLVIQTEVEQGALPDIRLKLDVNDADVTFDKNWPTVKSVGAQLTMDKLGAHVHVKSAQMSNVKVSDIYVDVPVKGYDVDWVNVKGSAFRESSEILHLLRSTPLAQSVLLPFEAWSISGDMKGTFDVSVPLNDKHPDPNVNLALLFKNNPLYIGDIDLEGVIKTGQFHYSTEKGIFDSNFDAQSFSGQSHIVLTSSIEKDGRMSVEGDITGRANLHDIAVWQKLPDYLADTITGDVDYLGTLAVNKSQDGQSDLVVKSGLEGGVITLPAPFAKTSEQVIPVTVKVGAHEHDMVIETSFGDLSKSRILTSAGAFSGGEVYFNSDEPLPKVVKKGLVLVGQFNVFDLLGWEKVFNQMVEKEGADELLEENRLKLPVWLRHVDMLVDHAVVNDQNTLHNIKVSYDTVDTKKQLEFASDELSFKFDHNGTKPRLHFGYLSWNTNQSVNSGSPDKPPFRAHQVPNMSLLIDQLYINQKPYGDWDFNIISSGNQLRITPFSTRLKKGKFDGHLIWQDDDTAPAVKLTMAVDGKDLADLIGKFTDQAFVTSKKYKINVVLNWKGHPFYFDRKSVSGKVSFDAKDGNFSQINELPVFMKVFGIFNIEALKRRLSLDFSDVYKSGLTYDSFKGVFTVHNGILKTDKPLEVASPGSEVSLKGSADLVNETLDEVLTATLPISRTLPLAGLLWGTPQLAGILYIADKLIGDTISKVTSVQYKVEGSFDNPVVTPVKHNSSKVKGKRVER